MTRKQVSLKPRKGAVLTRRLALIGGLTTVVGVSSFVTIAASAPPRLKPNPSWAVFYGLDADPAQFAPFELIVLDPNYSRPVPPLKATGTVVIGYLSLGEFNRTKPEFGMLQQGGALLQQNPNWPDSYSVDIRNPTYRSFVLNTLVPRLVEQGFDGLFLDTLDSSAHLEATDPQRYRGMRSAAISLVKAIREDHPRMPLIMNRGYAILPKLLGTVDAVVAESMITSYDAETKTYHRVDDETIARHLDFLKPARHAWRPLPILSLDYWDPEDVSGLQEVYGRERELGHSPYVGTVLLDQVVPEPAS